MADRRVLARLRIRQCGLHGPAVDTVVLATAGDELRLEVTRTASGERSCRRIPLPASEVRRRLDALQHATVPASPVSPMVMDGEYIELSIRGEFSDLTLGWWTIAPDGAEALAEFADWLRETGLTDVKEPEIRR